VHVCDGKGHVYPHLVAAYDGSRGEYRFVYIDAKATTYFGYGREKKTPCSDSCGTLIPNREVDQEKELAKINVYLYVTKKVKQPLRCSGAITGGSVAGAGLVAAGSDWFRPGTCRTT
jgi:hypothetical protein